VEVRALFLFLWAPAIATAAAFEINLKSVEDAAFNASSTLKGADLELQAAKSRDEAAWTALWPRLALDASDRYNTEVPEFSVIPKAPKIKFGDNNGYSLGIGATWVLWDSGNAYNLYKSLQALEAGKRADLEASKRQLRLRARLGYFQTQLMAERARLMADSLKLSQSVAMDIELRMKAGASSRIDSLSAKNEVLQRRGDYRQARADLASALRDLFALTGLGSDQDPSLPQEASAQDHAPDDTEAASLSLKLESLEKSLEELQGAESASFNDAQPQLQMAKAAAEAARRQAAALESGHWPRLQVSARSSYDYPDGPVLETIQQNSFAVSATWPLFAFGQVDKQVKEQENLGLAADARAVALTTDLRRDWLKSHDRLKALRDKKLLEEQSVTQTENLYKLIYNAYQNGSSSLLEVQTAELKALESKVRLASTETQMLIELAVLSSLSE
jgi:outer membrane protein TolC